MYKFPSPFGVICSLIYKIFQSYESMILKVSVSFRSYLFSNNLIKKFELNLEVNVSVSFRSYLFSNFLLFFIFSIFVFVFPSPFGVICSLIFKFFHFLSTPYFFSFRLLSELSVL